ncbi:ester cyclase [Streptomyces sp. NPDC059881]|uniref:ester cyclase n=1 Tax=Streptomyces sp. NPDC059881 TaxID=3346986 RepID=UPI003663703E
MTLSPADNKRRALDMVAAWNRGEPDGVIAYWAPDAVHYDEDGRPMPAEQIADIMRGSLDSFPDLHLEAKSIVAEEDRVMLRITVTATHAGDFMGVPATGKPVTWHYLEELRFNDRGQVVEHWDVMNFSPLFRALGHVPDGL